ncbi:MAG: deoxyribonuclease IV [Elusimicrobiota bacterium]|nr:MAG: deoxyribonuclease IV [Elusimicrobiota bacterium]
MGFDAALKEAVALGCASLQILPYPRHDPHPNPSHLASFNAARRAAGVRVLLVHSRFVPSLASSDPQRRRRSIEHLAHELELATALGADSYVIHGGAYSEGSSLDEGVRLFSESILEAVQRSSCDVPLLIENVPGGGRRMGGPLEEVARLYDALKPRAPSMAVCLDTAHAYAAGYDCSTIEGALKFIARAHRLMGFDAIKAFHLNDTRALLNSNRENHEHWGKGRLGSEGLKALLTRDEFSAVAGILETPKDGPESDRANLAFARALASA